MTVIGLRSVDLRSVDLCLGDLSSLYRGRVYRRERGSDSEEFEQVGLHVGQGVEESVRERALRTNRLDGFVLWSFSEQEKAALLILGAQFIVILAAWLHGARR